jgi:formylglycine-generating enzyme required for sulfatase activity
MHFSRMKGHSHADSARGAISKGSHLVQVEGFWIDQHDVTNAEFSKFVETTGYVTVCPY